MARFFTALALGTTLINWNPSPLTAQEWQPVALRTEAARAAGPGGEGCQWPLALAADPVEGKLLFFGTDVGGVYRSEDGGDRWTPANLGSNARGACAFAIDPKDISRVLMVGCNSLARLEHGLYLSTDRGATWRHVFPYANHGYRDVREQVAFDPTSASDGGHSRIAYWSAEAAAGLPARIHRSTDGGETWTPLDASEPIGRAILKIHPVKGWLYAGGPQGLFRSKDQGATFQKIFAEPIHGLDIIPTRPDSIYLATPTKMFRSDDNGATFQPLAIPANPPADVRGGLLYLKVNPNNPTQMAVNRDEGSYNWIRYFSHDGGQSWKRAEFDTRLSIIANNNRIGAIVWHPTASATAWSFGGDFLTRSQDGAATWVWNNHGYTGIMNGRSFIFNVRDPDLLYLPSQDYDGALTTNAGDTWKLLSFSGHHWGGFIYGGYAASPDLVFAGNRQSWDGPTELRLTRDGGRTYIKTGLHIDGEPIGYADPRKKDVFFFGNLRSTDNGNSWKPMKGCRGVFTHNPANPRELFGLDGPHVVLSTNGGQTWTRLATIGGHPLQDVAIDHRRNILYAANRDRLHLIDRATGTVTDITDRLPPDQTGARGAWSVAVDPVNPDVAYACRPANVYMSDASTFRTTDGGQTWHTLTRNLRQSAVTSGPDGAREAHWVRVHPRTRHAYFSTICFGLWKIAPPPGS